MGYTGIANGIDYISAIEPAEEIINRINNN